MISSILKGDLDNIDYTKHQIFGLKMLFNSCPNVPSKILNPKNTWENKSDYDK